jgi:hypothetical protein
MKKILTNREIFTIGNAFEGAFQNDERYLPAKINFKIEKNKKNILDKMNEIEESRIKTIREFGEEKDGQIQIPNEKVEEVNKEIAELFDIEQEMNIFMISFEDIENLEFTSAEMSALLFMIEDPEDEE